jgi:hypothetical protein
VRWNVRFCLGLRRATQSDGGNGKRYDYESGDRTKLVVENEILQLLDARPHGAVGNWRAFIST